MTQSEFVSRLEEEGPWFISDDEIERIETNGGLYQKWTKFTAPNGEVITCPAVEPMMIDNDYPISHSMNQRRSPDDKEWMKEKIYRTFTDNWKVPEKNPSEEFQYGWNKQPKKKTWDTSKWIIHNSDDGYTLEYRGGWPGVTIYTFEIYNKAKEVERKLSNGDVSSISGDFNQYLLVAALYNEDLSNHLEEICDWKQIVLDVIREK